MNTIIHDMEGQIEIGDTFKSPKSQNKGGKPGAFNRVIANAMWDKNWLTKAKSATAGLGRFPAKSSPGWSWGQHGADCTQALHVATLSTYS